MWHEMMEPFEIFGMSFYVMVKSVLCKIVIQLFFVDAKMIANLN